METNTCFNKDLGQSKIFTLFLMDDHEIII